MKNVINVLIGVLISFISLSGQQLKPYLLAGSVEGGDVGQISTEVREALKGSGFEILGSYSAVESSSRKLIAVSHPKLIQSVKKVGGFTGFASVLRVAITKESSVVNISYTNPEYWGPAYFTQNFPKVEAAYKKVAADFKAALNIYGKSEEFGSKKGLSKSKLMKYHYMMGMPYFDDNVKLASFADFNTACSRIDKNLKNSGASYVKVYEKMIPGTELKLYGVGLKGSKGETNFMPTIDTASPKHTAFLPYELLVYKNEVFMLHGRYRIALSFPDLTMGTFMKIVSTPGDIEEMMKSLCN